ncbi:MAG: TIGR03619 family F420-dependent LLM class oxidoreductase [Alphaproteobacteria bacterium]|jgi:probable F420-dependent oxidoreductase|nr:TIGR03619 family F420-dependent LLM class oxidoreductase [Alphaproteobacteria bacterium]
MKFGYFGFNMGPLGVPEAITEILGAVERCGFESAWTGEHVVAIDPQVPPSPIAPDHPMLDTIAALSFAAAATNRLKLGSGIILLAQRNPVVLAKELAGIDVLSQGRLLVGVGVGYVAGEFEALGIPYGERGARVSEHIEAMRALWTQDKPAFKGRFSSFDGIQSKPSPVQKPHPPIIIGGMSAAAYRRAVRHGSGWYGFNQTLEAAAGSIAGLAAAAKETERPAALGPLSISISPKGGVDGDTVKRFEDLGVERLILLPKGRGGPTERAVQFVEETAEKLSLA